MKTHSRNRFFRHEVIVAFSAIFLVIAFAITFISSKYMNKCLKNETQAQQNRFALHFLGENLADASDYLTNEARRFTMTGDIGALYNYWHEVYVVKERERVIREISEYSLSEKEIAMLSGAKAYSDTLISKEILSMKLILLSGNYTLSENVDEETDSYIQHVMSFSVPEKYEKLSAEELCAEARNLLYDNDYYRSKNLIMSPINEFQNVIDKRLYSEVSKAVDGKNIAFAVHTVCSVIVIIILAVTVFIFSALYVSPLKKYSEKLNSINYKNHYHSNDFSAITLEPSGAHELYNFAVSYNKISESLNEELLWHVNAEDKMRIARDEADRANHAKSDFFAHMSHELRTPLNAVIGYLYLLNNTVLSEKQKKYCYNIDYSSRNLMDIINNILDFSKIEQEKMTFEKTQFSLKSLINDTYNMMKNSALQKSIELKLELSSDMPDYVIGDPMRLRQVLVNLIGNAVKFTEIGEVSIKVGNEVSDDNNCTVIFSVSDSGIGIQSANQKKIFDPFVQNDIGVTRKYGGTGLGLPISKKIVENLSDDKYTISVNSEYGKGSIFTFRMDFEKCDYVAEKRESVLSVDRFDNTIEILLVDDNEINLEMEKTILESMGLNVATASCGEEALKYAETNNYALILLDLHMPVMDGYETARKLRRLINCRNIPIIALTADVVSGVREKVRNSGMDGYLSKPFKVDKLRKLIADGIDIADNSSKSSDYHMIFDYESCLLKLGGDKEKLISIIDSFWKRHKNDAEYIKNHIENGMYENADSILHNIIGVSGNLCCDRLYNESRKLRDEIRNSKIISTDEFVKCWNETIDVMNVFIKKQSINLPVTVSENEKIIIIDTFTELCSNYDFSALGYFNSNSDKFRKILDNARFKKLETYICSFDFKRINSEFGKKDDYV